MFKFQLVLVLFVSLCYVIQCEEITKENAASIAHECKDESGASDEDIEAMLKHDVPDTSEAKCLRACVMKKFEIMSADGKLITNNAIKLVKAMTKDDAEKEAAGIEIVNACEELEVSENHCDAAAEYEACVREQVQVKGITSLEF